MVNLLEMSFIIDTDDSYDNQLQVTNVLSSVWIDICYQIKTTVG